MKSNINKFLMLVILILQTVLLFIDMKTDTLISDILIVFAYSIFILLTSIYYKSEVYVHILFMQLFTDMANDEIKLSNKYINTIKFTSIASLILSLVVLSLPLYAIEHIILHKALIKLIFAMLLGVSVFTNINLWKIRDNYFKISNK